MTPDSPLLAYVLATLTAMLTPTLDPALARRAAQEALAQAGTDPLTSAQTVAFALSALDSLRLSMPDTVSLSMKLKLRGNANAARRRSAASGGSSPYAKASGDRSPRGDSPAPPKTAPKLSSQDWAGQMREAATHLQPASPTDALWIDALTNVATQIAAEKAPPNAGRAALLRSTWMASNPAIPPDLFRVKRK